MDDTTTINGTFDMSIKFFITTDRKLQMPGSDTFHLDGNWIEETQGTLMTVATLIATITFQTAPNPPGGVWQEDVTDSKTNICNEKNICFAGTTVAANALLK